MSHDRQLKKEAEVAEHKKESKRGRELNRLILVIGLVATFLTGETL
jgi:hypothetical protein